MIFRRVFQSSCLLCVSNTKSPIINHGRRHLLSSMSSTTSEEAAEDGSSTDKKLSKAMKAYIQRAQAYNEFIKREEQEYNIGKRHLANMMGYDPETFTQEQVDEAIEYLFPSGVFDKRARPMMKLPQIVFPPQKDAQFDESGRPYHYLFYTGKPNFYSLLHDVATNLKTLDTIEDKNKMEHQNKPSKKINLEGSAWLSKKELETKIVEALSDKDYKNFVLSMERLAEHRYSFQVEDFIMSWRQSLMDSSLTTDIPQPLEDDQKRKFITVKECRRKSATAEVTVKSPGTGLININGKDIEYFESTQSRGQILFPLELTGLLGSVDVEAVVQGGGETGQAGAIRWGLAWGLRSFVTSDMVETMRLAGLLTKDVRCRERKKPGQAKARRKFTWKKR